MIKTYHGDIHQTVLAWWEKERYTVGMEYTLSCKFINDLLETNVQKRPFPSALQQQTKQTEEFNEEAYPTLVYTSQEIEDKQQE